MDCYHRFEKLPFTGFGPILVAGDSNVHRINDVVDAPIKCLPISGARYTNDKKEFRKKLKACLRQDSYRRLYLFLGSNDVLISHHVFYRNVSKMCDMVHEVTPNIDIVLIEIPPRGQDQRKWRMPSSKLKKMQEWIVGGNSILRDISLRTPFVRCLSTDLRTHHLTFDGLHLGRGGAEQCYKAIVKDINLISLTMDNMRDRPIFDCSSTSTFDSENWPALGKVQTEEKEKEFHRTYADIVQTKAVSDMHVQEEINKEESHEKIKKYKSVLVKCRQPQKKGSWKSRFERRRKKWLNKKFARNVYLRSVKHCQDYVVVRITDDVAVEVPTGVCLRAKEPSVAVCQPAHKINCKENTQKRTRRNQKWLPCPECDVVCSRDDFLLDHVIKRHIKLKETVSTSEDYRKANSTVSKTKDETYEASFYNICEEFVHSSPHLSFEKDVNTCELEIVLSNDVNLNPGPTLQCKWENCIVVCCNIRDLDTHVLSHLKHNNNCRWEGCPGYSSESLSLLEMHVIRHLYDNEDLFPTLEDWIAIQTDGKLTKTTNLYNCPKHLRSKLKMLLFDEDFNIPQQYYTTEDHGKYLDFLSLHYPSQFEIDGKKFLAKRCALGEDWPCNEYPVNSDRPSTSSVSNTPRNLYSVSCESKFDFVNTTRPELSSSFYSGTNLKPQGSQKRKHSFTETSSLEEPSLPWFNNVLSNLSTCHQAITIQRDILNKIQENGIVESANQKFFTIEQETAKLAATENCTSGTLVCFVFKCLINEEEIYYIRYLESGCFSGFMEQKLLNILREKYNFSNNKSFLHCVYTNEDLIEIKHAANNKTIKRVRPDKIRNKTLLKILPTNVNEIKSIACSSESSDLSLESYLINIWPFKPGTSADCPETPYLEVGGPLCSSDLKKCLVDYRMHRTDLPIVTSMDIFENNLPNNNLSMLQQSMKLNCLSANIKREQSKHLYKRPGRYEANFLQSHCQTSSLRNHILVLYLAKDFKKLYSFLISYFPDLAPAAEFLEHTSTVHEEVPCSKKAKKNTRVNNVSVDKSLLEKGIKYQESNVTSNTNTNLVSLFDTFCFQLVQHGKLSIQSLDESGDVVCVMNDYSATDGSFRETEFVFTSKLMQETGNYFFCSCSTYSTLLDINKSQSKNEFVVLDSTGENCVTCMHCKFLSQYIIPNLEPGNAGCGSSISKFVQNALQDNGKELVELIRTKNTRKFSVFLKEEGQPTLVHITFSQRIGKHIVSCLNGQCLSKKGHKRNVDSFEHATTCKHLSVLKNHIQHWQDLKTMKTTDLDKDEENHLNETENNFISLDIPEISSGEESNFDEKTGLWQFKCKSLHKPKLKGSESLQLNLQKRDLWNDNNLKRDKDGYLVGPTLFPDIPDNTCSCGAGWLKREDDENYNENGKTVNEGRRVLTIYTSSAPVKCQIHSRICYSQNNPCKILWDEGHSDCLHVLSRDTAAGDEIGWEFVSLVMNSGCTFASFCKLKNELYQLRDNRAKFMDPTVFLNWWFSWAANMKIDFRQSCDVCGFEPKRLCCDGTNIGVGFRHASFEEIESVDSEAYEHKTLHRRMSRCFLKNCQEIGIPQTMKNREMLDYLARESLGELTLQEILTPEDRKSKITLLRQALSDEFILSFDKFFPIGTPSCMHINEQIAYAYVIKMLATTASVTSILPPKYCSDLQQLLDPHIDDISFNHVMNNMRYYAPELRDLIAQSLVANNSDDGKLEDYISSFLKFLINESVNLQVIEPEPAVLQPGTYNPAKNGRAYYFNEFGLKLRNVRKFTIDRNKSTKVNDDHDDAAQGFEKCQKQFSKANNSARGTTSLFLWFCADHGHCYGFHMTYAEGRKDPSASLYSHLEHPPTDIFYDFACNLQEYCLNRESGYYKDVRFFHDIFHGYSHKCSCAFRSSRLKGFECVNSEICEQFNSFLQNIKKSARQMTQEHFCFYLQFFLHEWNTRKKDVFQKKIKVALAGLE